MGNCCNTQAKCLINAASIEVFPLPLLRSDDHTRSTGRHITQLNKKTVFASVCCLKFLNVVVAMNVMLTRIFVALAGLLIAFAIPQRVQATPFTMTVPGTTLSLPAG